MTHQPEHRDDAVATLRQAGLRVTSPRLATLAVVEKHQHADADTIAAAVRERLGTVSTQAVYDVLRALTEVQLLRKVDADGRRAVYELNRHDNHHHLICRECGELEDVPCAVGQAPCLQPHADHGFELEVAEVLYRGLCPRCREQRTRRPPEGARRQVHTRRHRDPLADYAPTPRPLAPEKNQEEE